MVCWSCSDPRRIRRPTRRVRRGVGRQVDIVLNGARDALWIGEHIAHDPTDEVEAVPRRFESDSERPRKIDDEPKPLRNHGARLPAASSEHRGDLLTPPVRNPTGRLVSKRHQPPAPDSPGGASDPTGIGATPAHHENASDVDRRNRPLSRWSVAGFLRCRVRSSRCRSAPSVSGRPARMPRPADRLGIHVRRDCCTAPL